MRGRRCGGRRGPWFWFWGVCGGVLVRGSWVGLWIGRYGLWVWVLVVVVVGFDIWLRSIVWCLEL